MLTEEKNMTPMMAQWHHCKRKAGEALLLFRMGDFYEAFHEDAVLLSETLDVTLTKRQDVPMAGIPFHSYQNHMDRLLARGLKVAVAEQVENPKQAKGLVKREVVRIITPGTPVESELLKAETHHYMACTAKIGSLYGLSLIDITTGDFRVFETSDRSALLQELYRSRPAEILFSKKLQQADASFFRDLANQFSFTETVTEEWHFDPKTATDFLMKHFGLRSLDGLGLKGMICAVTSASVLLGYISETLCHRIDHIRTLKKIEEKTHLLLDHISLRHLEIVESYHPEKGSRTLLSLLDKTRTAPGARLLREWLLKPLLSVEEIRRRQDGIEDFLSHPSSMPALRKILSSIRDPERLTTKISTGFGGAVHIRALHRSLQMIPFLKEALAPLGASFLASAADRLIDMSELTDFIDRALVDDPPVKPGEGRTFKEGFHPELDEWLQINRSSKRWMADYQTELRAETGIKTLKVGYNRVFGYYIEVSKGQAATMPDRFLRRQTLANNERFFSEELKNYESKILHAEENIASLEADLLEKLREKIVIYRSRILECCRSVAEIDALLSLASVAGEKHYVKPMVDNGPVLRIDEGRHPVLDSLCHFIPNDTFLDDEKQRLMMITGPNMAGKSTYIRQVALLVIMAQIGSYIPAQSAHIGITEKIFSRIGASDNLAEGQSTFMVEMTETANILRNLSDRSLIILDEIGRGTGTYDGIAIARSTAQYLLKHPCKVLFATHYSELTELENNREGVVNYTVSIREDRDSIIFLYKIIKGKAQKSYGIHVAELAGLPPEMIAEARTILRELETGKRTKKNFSESKSFQLSFLPSDPEESLVLKELKELDIHHLSPIEALLILKKFQERI